ncbi:HTH-type transcriptional regulator YhaJ [Pseudomonas fluorescens]|nr:HTH-type transcriptional regulator YhaJ [Pseudomonas fluorescens]
MIDAMTLDQLRVFVTIVDCGSFSAAARHLRRAQSAVSNAISNLEEALGLSLFDRSGWKPKLTSYGHSLLIDSRKVLISSDQLKAHALALTKGLETDLSLAVDVMFPVDRLVRLVAEFRRVFPTIELRLHTDVLGGVAEKVIAEGYDLGIQGSLPDISPGLVSHVLPGVSLAPVSAPDHPLADKKHLSHEQLQEHVQVVLTDRTQRTEGQIFSVFSKVHILTSDLGSKHALLRAGLGWGFMPGHVAQEDLENGRLVELDLAKRSPRSRNIPLLLVYRANNPPGPAGQWVIDRLIKN